MALFQLVTAEDLYLDFLREIRRESTVVVPPERWNNVFNKAALQWAKSKLPENQFNQKRIDDLQILHVDTDGDLYPMIPVIGTHEGQNLRFEVPMKETPIYGFTYPIYMHGISAMFKVVYSDSPCNVDGVSPLLPASYLRSDQRSQWLNNEYRKPKDDRLLYEIISNSIRLATGMTSGLSKTYGHSMRLEYYRYPTEVLYFGKKDPRNVDSEFNPTINEEIQSIAVMNFLERRESPRLQSFMGVEGTKIRQK